MRRVFGCFLAASLAFLPQVVAADEVDEAVLQLAHEWAHIKYEMPEKKQKEAYAQLAEKAHQISQRYPNRAEPLIWEAIIKSTYAGAKGGFGALRLMKEARDLLLKAEKINPKAMHGAIYTSLGSFYYMVPGWPIGYGDDDKAYEYLKKGLEIGPNDMDAHFFMGDFLYRKHRYEEAAMHLRKVLSLPDVPDRPVYSKGRKAEARELLEKIDKKLKH